MSEPIAPAIVAARLHAALAAIGPGLAALCDDGRTVTLTGSLATALKASEEIHAALGLPVDPSDHVLFAFGAQDIAFSDLAIAPQQDYLHLRISPADAQWLADLLPDPPTENGPCLPSLPRSA